MNRTCNKCNWVHFGVTREFAEEGVNSFNKMYNKLSKQDQEENFIMEVDLLLYIIMKNVKDVIMIIKILEIQNLEMFQTDAQ